MVDPSVDAAVDTAQPGLAGGGAVAVEGPGHAGEHVRGDGDPVVVTEEAGQHRGSGAADSAVGTGIGRIGRRGQERSPARVTGGGRVAVVVCIPDGCDGSPEMEVILGVVEGDGGVRQRKVEKHEQSRCAYQVGVVGESRLFRDLVPGGPDGARPELRDDRLIGCTAGAGVLTQALHFVESLGVGRTGECRRCRGPELIGLVEHEGRHQGPLSEDRR